MSYLENFSGIINLVNPGSYLNNLDFITVLRNVLTELYLGQNLAFNIPYVLAIVFILVGSNRFMTAPVIIKSSDGAEYRTNRLKLLWAYIRRLFCRDSKSLNNQTQTQSESETKSETKSEIQTDSKPKTD